MTSHSAKNAARARSADVSPEMTAGRPEGLKAERIAAVVTAAPDGDAATSRWYARLTRPARYALSGPHRAASR